MSRVEHFGGSSSNSSLVIVVVEIEGDLSSTVDSSSFYKKIKRPHLVWEAIAAQFLSLAIFFMNLTLNSTFFILTIGKAYIEMDINIKIKMYNTLHLVLIYYIILHSGLSQHI